MICDNIPKVKRPNRFYDTSHFEVVFSDGSIAHEKDVNWSSMSTEKVVDFLEEKKMVMVSVHPVKKIKVHHKGLETIIDVPDGCDVYQAFRSRTTDLESGKSEIIGRTVGLVKDGKIIEERFLDAVGNQVLGLRTEDVKEKKNKNSINS